MGVDFCDNSSFYANDLALIYQLVTLSVSCSNVQWVLKQVRCVLGLKPGTPVFLSSWRMNPRGRHHPGPLHLREGPTKKLSAKAALAQNSFQPPTLPEWARPKLK